MEQPGRKYSAGSGYRYGFNGQEKDKELNENITTAEFWEYDSKVVRRWNVDPVYRNSPFEINSGNPIVMCDVKGDDDYWALNPQTGKVIFLGSTSNGRNIKVITTAENMAMVKSGKLDSEPSLVKKYNEKSVLISDIKVDLKSKTSDGVANIMADYAVLSGMKVECKGGNTVGIATDTPDCLAYTDKKAVYVNASDGNIDPLLSDWGNLISTFHHEKKHVDGEGHSKLGHALIILDQLRNDRGIITEDYALLMCATAAKYLEQSKAQELSTLNEYNQAVSSLQGLQLVNNIKITIVTPTNDPNSTKRLVTVESTISGQNRIINFDINDKNQ